VAGAFEGVFDSGYFPVRADESGCELVRRLGAGLPVPERLSDPATRHILKREFEVYGKPEFERLAKLSNGVGTDWERAMVTRIL
jgi:hypothetical protein